MQSEVNGRTSWHLTGQPPALSPTTPITTSSVENKGSIKENSISTNNVLPWTSNDPTVCQWQRAWVNAANVKSTPGRSDETEIMKIGKRYKRNTQGNVDQMKALSMTRFWEGIHRKATGLTHRYNSSTYTCKHMPEPGTL